jgi:hypothetical protein
MRDMCKDTTIPSSAQSVTSSTQVPDKKITPSIINQSIVETDKLVTKIQPTHISTHIPTQNIIHLLEVSDQTSSSELEELMQQERVMMSNYEKSKGVLKGLTDSIKLEKNKLATLNTSLSDIKNRIKNIKNNIERDALIQKYESMLKESKKDESAKIDDMEECDVRLIRHLLSFKSVMWYEHFIYAFTHKPDNNERAIEYVNSIPDKVSVNDRIRTNMKSFLANHQSHLINAVNDRSLFIDFILEFRNMYAIMIGENFITDNEMLDQFEVTD